MRTVKNFSRLLKSAAAASVVYASTSAFAEPPVVRDPPLLREMSSARMPACKVEPFADEGAAQREAQWNTPCGGDHARWQIEAPRFALNRPDTRFTKAEFGTMTTEKIAGVLSTLKFSWAGTRDQETGHARSNSTMVAAGGLIRLLDDVDLQLNLGRQIVGAAQTRATMVSSWRPTQRGLLFSEWSATSTPGPDAKRVGARWWLIPRKLALDFGARYVPDGSGWHDQRIGLTFSGLRF
ncbi:hypothetical protein BH09PSE5_BH09PSE5_31430 [soil metagenome]